VQTIAHTFHDLPWVYRDCPPNYQGEIYLLLIFPFSTVKPVNKARSNDA